LESYFDLELAARLENGGDGLLVGRDAQRVFYVAQVVPYGAGAARACRARLKIYIDAMTAQILNSTYSSAVNKTNNTTKDLPSAIHLAIHLPALNSDLSQAVMTDNFF
jgi:hypothetical protein